MQWVYYNSYQESQNNTKNNQRNSTLQNENHHNYDSINQLNASFGLAHHVCYQYRDNMNKSPRYRSMSRMS